jgi:predicted nucleic acid-binding protein
MPFYQCDSSCLVKRYVDEVGSDWVRIIMDPASAHIVSIADITRAEVTSAFARRAREGVITLHERDELIRPFEPTAPRNIASSRLSRGLLTLPLNFSNAIRCGLTTQCSWLLPVLSINR